MNRKHVKNRRIALSAVFVGVFSILASLSRAALTSLQDDEQLIEAGAAATMPDYVSSKEWPHGAVLTAARAKALPQEYIDDSVQWIRRIVKPEWIPESIASDLVGLHGYVETRAGVTTNAMIRVDCIGARYRSDRLWIQFFLTDDWVYVIVRDDREEPCGDPASCQRYIHSFLGNVLNEQKQVLNHARPVVVAPATDLGLECVPFHGEGSWWWNNCTVWSNRRYTYFAAMKALGGSIRWRPDRRDWLVGPLHRQEGYHPQKAVPTVVATPAFDAPLRGESGEDWLMRTRLSPLLQRIDSLSLEEATKGAELAMTLRRHDDAKNLQKRAISLTSDTATLSGLYYGLGSLTERPDEGVECREAYAKCFDLGANDKWSLKAGWRLGDLYSSIIKPGTEPDPEKAQYYYEETIRRFGTKRAETMQCLLHLAFIYGTSGRNKAKAIETLKIVANTNPDEVVIEPSQESEEILRQSSIKGQKEHIAFLIEEANRAIGILNAPAPTPDSR